ncbi:hypothetical protein CYMTET_43830 [Cymbomonas tetramitiformis]|uniref:Uncharacterized protein n=1 Tax=Cymbomonas tetramitiformis TaxID=36881 RepID=A0AAE0EZX0_9CHLO|nr:hypothetical protein CYMTET_43830 [Cymbomonas tetramitiformis]
MQHTNSYRAQPFRRPRVTASAWKVAAPATQRSAAGASSSSAAVAAGSTGGQRGPPPASHTNPTHNNIINTSNNDDTAAGGDSRDKSAPCYICYDTKQFVYGNRCLLCNSRNVPGPGASHPSPRNRLASPEGIWAGWKHLFRLCDNHRKKEWQPAVREALEWMDSGKLRARLAELEAQLQQERNLVGELREELEQREVRQRPQVEFASLLRPVAHKLFATE